MKTSFTLGGVEFHNRVFVASGTYGYGDDCLEFADVNRLGGIMTKSLSLKPRDGNASPRIVETAGGMLNSIGLANIGVERFVREKLPVLRSLKTRVIANIAASTVEEYRQVLDILERADGVDGYEINVSCPNVKEGGLSFGTSRELTGKITRYLREGTKKPLIIKLTPNVTHIGEFARVAEDAGADAISVINTVIGMAVNLKKRTPVLPTITGGLSGPAIKPIALAKVYESSRAVRIPVIGVGGIMTVTDALEFLVAGATAVQIGTANFLDPGTGMTIADDMEKYCKEQGIEDLGSLVGSLDAQFDDSILQSWQ